MITREQVLWNVHTALGMPRQEWGLTNADIFHAIEMGAMPLFSKYYPYFTQVKITPQDKTPQPGLYKIPIKDYTRIISIGKFVLKNTWNTRDGIAASPFGAGYGYQTSSQNPIQTLNQLNMVNMNTIETPYEYNVQFESPNFVKIDPVNIYRYIEGILDVKLKHDMSFRTIDDGLHDIFIELCVLYVKYMLYNRYRDLKDGVLNGVNISTDIDEWSGAEDGIKEWSDGRKTQYYKHRKRIRAQYMFF